MWASVVRGQRDAPLAEPPSRPSKFMERAARRAATAAHGARHFILRCAHSPRPQPGRPARLRPPSAWTAAWELHARDAGARGRGAGR